MSDIFISYASQDRAIAQRLATALAGEGWSVWWDRTIMPGKSFARMIEEALNDAKCVVVLWSTVSRDSDWVQNEARHGHERRALIPALIEDVKPPFEFQHIHAAPLIGWDGDAAHSGYRQLVAAISGLAGAPPEEEEAKRKAQEREAKRAAEEESRKKAEAEAARKKEQEERQKAEAEAKRAAEKEAVRREAEKQAQQRAEAKRKPSKAPWLAAGALVVLLAIGLAVGQPWRSSSGVLQTAERSDTKPETKPDVATGAKRLQPGETFRDCDACPEMVVIAAGSFSMGSPDTDADADANTDEKPQHRVDHCPAVRGGRVRGDTRGVCRVRGIDEP